MADYDALRQSNMAANKVMMDKLGLTGGSLTQDKGKKKNKNKTTKKREAAATHTVQRKSARSAGKPAPTYTPSDFAAEQVQKGMSIAEEKALGYRGSDGFWAGERFGEVAAASGAAGKKTIKAGTVFGAGDYQRAGRTEMVANGFFRPFVTPEWVHPKGLGCYSLILNNDNGLSLDKGEVVQYAGSGGRRRGQNRTAPQSFDQDWHNATNAALKTNFETQKPVRVIRGPKLQGGYGTGEGDGGYRYDGLYLVKAAELVVPAGEKYKTAIFHLQKVIK